VSLVRKSSSGMLDLPLLNEELLARQGRILSAFLFKIVQTAFGPCPLMFR
jgi:hypothetical protein